MQNTFARHTIEMDKIYTVAELSVILGCSKQNIVQHIRRGNLKAMRLGLRTYGILGRWVKDMYSFFSVEFPFIEK